MVEREAKRLEVLKRRQEREMNQLVQFELMRNAMQVNPAQQPAFPPSTLLQSWRDLRDLHARLCQVVRGVMD